MKTFCTVLVLATALAGRCDAGGEQVLTLQVEREVIRSGAAIRATATVANHREATAEWIFEAYLYSTDPSAAVPRKMSKPVRLAPRAGSYELRTELFDSRYQLISREVAPIRIEGLPGPVGLTITICRDADCKVPARIFVRGETVYLGYSSDPPAAHVSTVLVVNGKIRKELSLPTSIVAQESGDYFVTVVASSPERRSVTKNLGFAVRDADSK
jgi:hypothetical protein